MDWAISNQAPNRGRFNDYPVREYAQASGSWGHVKRGDIVYPTWKHVAVRKDGSEIANRFECKVKRAGFKVGIGRELYSSPFIFLNVETESKSINGKEVWYLKDKFAKFEVKDIAYENRKISKLVIVNQKTGEVVYTFGANTNSRSTQKRTSSNLETKQDSVKKETAKKEEPKQETPKAENVGVKNVTPNVAVDTVNTIPSENMPKHKELFLNFLKRHNIPREKFIEMRSKAVNEGKKVSAKSFNDLTPEEWIELLNAMESLCIEGYFKDVA